MTMDGRAGVWPGAGMPGNKNGGGGGKGKAPPGGGNGKGGIPGGITGGLGMDEPVAIGPGKGI